MELGTPYTVIGLPTRRLSMTSLKANLDAESDFRPPAATWYDETHGHFAVLLDRKHEKTSAHLDEWGLVSDNHTKKNRKDDSEVVHFATISAPGSELGKPPMTSGNQRQQQPQRITKQRMLPMSEPMGVRLPWLLACVKNDESMTELVATRTMSEDSEDNGERAVEMSHQPYKRRVPSLAKFSRDKKVMALQYSSTMIRIAPVLTEIKSLKDSVHQRQWVIDLSTNSSSPIACTSQTMPPPQAGRAAGLSFKKFGAKKNNNNNEEEEDILKYGTILPGGVMWSDHGGKSQDLIIITTTTVILYKISLSRNSAAKSHMFTHPLAIAFWYEPISRTLMLGSYSPNQSYYKSKLSKKVDINDLSLKEDKDSDSEEESHPPSVLVMRTFFLQMPPPDKSVTSGVVSNDALLDEMNNSFNDSKASVAQSTEATSEGNSFFPRLELPPPDRVPPFATGLSRGVYHSTMHSQQDSSQSDEEEDMVEVVAANDITLVNIYGEPYCIEVGSLGHGHGITLYKLIKDGTNSTLRVKTVIPDNFSLPRTSFDSTLIYVVDNLLCIMSKETKSTLFIDIKKMYYKSSNPKESMVVVEEPSNEKQPDVKSVYEEGLSFLPPFYMLDPQGRGVISYLKLNIASIADAFPVNTCSVSMLLRRRTLPSLSRSLAMDHFDEILDSIQQNANDVDSISVRRLWLDAVADIYSASKQCQMWDYRTSSSFVFQCALLPSSAAFLSGYNPYDYTQLSADPPIAYQSIITQTEMCEQIFLPRAKIAMSSKDTEQLEFITQTLLEYLGALDRHYVSPCPALQCLLVALLWRLDFGREVLSMLRAERFQRTIDAEDERRESKNDGNSKGEEASLSSPMEESMRSGRAMFAEMVIVIVNNVTLGIGVDHDKTNILVNHKVSAGSVRDSIITRALDILIATSSYHIAAKLLLSWGRVLDAISVCSKAALKTIYDKPPSHQHPYLTGPSSDRLGTSAQDFFKATVQCARSYADVGDRCRLFQHLFTFLKLWEPACFSLESRQMKVQMPRRATIDSTISFVVISKSNRQSLMMLDNISPILISGKNERGKDGVNYLESTTKMRRRISTGSVRSVRASFRSKADQEGSLLPFIHQSQLAHNVSYFPDELFGGANSEVTDTVQILFGFPASNVTS
eukprot:CAMPEP_0198290548 /NCGR_PEP_ID=MMETSP1449-20131203/8368_1 /TAXON_ID=420275 /ORGANISM="Attheya septentrionalis, Strain CCMP2084" /LENGTH=1144 /DNA_ID=CAMNT_0043989057 /DNA_START=135 /DNA_END=3569 /DNA_ORIENTATION=-